MIAKRGSALAVKFGPALPRGASGVSADAPAADVQLDARFSLAACAQRLGCQLRVPSCD